MKNINKLSSFCESYITRIHIIFTIYLVLSVRVFAQPQYSMTLENGNQLNDHTFEFEVFIRSSGDDFPLSSYQCAFSFNSEIVNGGELTLTFIEGTSDLNNQPFYAIGCDNTDGVDEFSFASFIGNDIIGTDQLKVGKFKIENTVSFGNVAPDIVWNFDGVVATIITGIDFTNLTTAGNHGNLNYSLLLESKEFSTFPMEYSLEQNYPNPFNPTTKIKFSIPDQYHVKIKIFNSIGEEVVELVDNFFLPGSYEVTFNANGLSSGLYIYRIETQAYVETKKMLLIK